MHDSKIHVIASKIHQKSRFLGFLLNWAADLVRWAENIPAYMLFITWFAYFLVLELPVRRLFFNPANDAKKQNTVLFLSNEGYLYAPARVRCYEFAKGLNERGTPTRVFTLFDHIFRFDGFPKRYLFQFELVLASIRAFYILAPQKFPVIICQRPSYDLICAFAIKLVQKSKLYFDVDDWTFEYVYLKGIKARSLYKCLAKFTSGMIVSSRKLEEEMKKYRFPQIHKIPTYVDQSRFSKKENYAANEVLFGWNGTLFEEFNLANIRILIRAFEKAYQTKIEKPAMRMEILGGGAYREHLKKELKEKYAHLPITVRDWMDPKQMPSYLQSIDVGLYSLALPSNVRDVKEQNRILNFQLSKSPTKLFEYMACGVPCISTAMGEAPHFIESGKTGLIGENEDQLAEHFLFLAGDKLRREEIGNQAYETCIAHFTLKSSAKMLSETIGFI